MNKADIAIEIILDSENPKQTVIKTNARKKGIVEILESWLLLQQGQGKDNHKPNTEDIYKIRIELDLSDDTFRTHSNTGNKSLTCGIVLWVLMMLSTDINKLKIEDLAA